LKEGCNDLRRGAILGKRSKIGWETLLYSRHCLVAVEPGTGRTHRVQSSDLVVSVNSLDLSRRRNSSSCRAHSLRGWEGNWKLATGLQPWDARRSCYHASVAVPKPLFSAPDFSRAVSTIGLLPFFYSVFVLRPGRKVQECLLRACRHLSAAVVENSDPGVFCD